MDKPRIEGRTVVCGIEVPKIAGGFGTGKRSMLAKSISEMHSKDLRHVNEAINNNRSRFVDGADVLDVKGTPFAVDLVDSGILTQNSLNAANNVFLLSERGYAKLLKIFDDDLAWDKYEEILDGYFRAKESTADLNELSPILQHLIKQELEQNALKKEVSSLKDGLGTLTDNLTAVPDAAKVKSLINEYQRWTRIDFDQIYGAIYETLLNQHGIDVRRRIENERDRLDAEYFAKKGRRYSTQTLKSKVTGIDVMVRMGVLDKFHSILVGMLAKEKANRKF